MPAAAVIQERRTLFVVIGCKGYVDGFMLFSLKQRGYFLINDLKNKTRVISKIIKFLM